MLPETEDVNTPLLASSPPIQPSQQNKPLKCSLNEMYRKAMISSIWLIFTGYITGIAGAIADNRAIKLYGNHPQTLGDLGMDLIKIIFGSLSIDAKASEMIVSFSLSL